MEFANKTKAELIAKINKLQLEVAENKLQESEIRFKALNNASFGGIAIHDNGIILECNQGLSDMTGYSNMELIGMNGLLLIAEKSRDLVMNNISSAYKKSFDAVGLHKNGEEFPMCLEGRNIPYKGKTVRTIEFRDITNRIEAENKLRESESLLKQAQEMAQIGHWVLDIVNNKLSWSDEIYRIFEVDPQEFDATYEGFLDNIHPEDREMTNKAYSDSLVTKKPYEIGHRLKLKDGTIKYVIEKCESTFDKNGKPLRSIGTVQDITKLKIVEEELRKSENRFKQLFNDLGDAVYVTRIGGVNKGQILEVNTAATLQTGYTRKELLNMNIINDIYILGSGEITTDEWEEKLSNRESVTTKEMKRRKDGTEFWTEVNVTSIDFKGELASLSINKDITERKLAEDRTAKETERTKLLLELRSKASQLLDKELFDFVLDKAVALTDSKVGFFNQVDKDQKSITLTTCNKQAIEKCDVSYETHYSIDVAGNWGDCVHQKQPVIYNDFLNSPNQKGLPDGHFPLKRFMSIPVVDKDVVHYVFGVGNKETDYEEHDMHQIQLIANELYKIIKQQQADDEIRKLNEELEEKVKERTQELSQEKNFSDVVINSLPGIFSLIAKDGSHIRWNKNHENVSGFSANEYKEMKAVEFFQGSDRGNVVKAMSEIIEKGKSHVETNLLTKSGKSIPYLFSGMSIEINNKIYVAGMGIDISDRKHAEKELQKKSEDLEAFNNVMIEREIRIIEMKEEVNKLSEQIGIEPPYPPVWKNNEPATEKNKDES